MALFAKKDKADSNAPAASSSDAAAPGASARSTGKKGLSIGRKKGATATATAPAPSTAAAGQAAEGGAGGFEDFADFSESALLQNESAPDAAGVPSASATPPASTRKTKKGLSGGAVVGLNIGNQTIKAVELRGKGETVAVTALGSIATPPDSIVNGVVTNSLALSHAIRDLFTQSSIKSRRVISSVAGTGSLVVRVIEVPRMSDNELRDNMAVDADRYIPFPPSEVFMDFQALRDLPADPDNPNMEVLLAAAQREIIDDHVKVLTQSKLDPRAIDVEPLAASRALFYDGLGDSAKGRNNDAAPDYNEVSAAINIGATTTEISVLRGDVLVFTRSIPRGGHSLTEALAGELDLTLSDAERLKIEVGDALPPFGVAPHAPLAATRGGSGGASLAPTISDDFAGFDAAFGSDLGGASVGGQATAAPPATPASAPITDVAPLAPEGDQDWGDFGNFAAEEGDANAADPASPATGGASSDPFDLDFFNQGPLQDEPGEQHQQKQNDDDPFDFSDFTLDEARANADNLPAQRATPGGDDDDEFANIPGIHEGGQGGAEASGAVPLDWQSAQHPEETAPSGQMFHFDTVDDPSLPQFPTLPSHLAMGVAGEDDFDTLPSVAEPSSASAAQPLPESETQPVLPSQAAAEAAPPSETATPAAPAGFSFSFNEDSPTTDLAAAVSEDARAEFADIPAPGPELTEVIPAMDQAPVSATDEPSHIATAPVELETAPGLATEGAGVSTSNADIASAFDLGSLSSPPASASASASASAPPLTAGAATAPVVAEPMDSAEALDLDDLLGPDVAGAADPLAGLLDDSELSGPIAAAPALAGVVGANAIDAAAPIFDTDLDSFGAGLTGDALLTGVSPERVHEIIEPILEELVGEVRRSLEYFASRYPDSGVRKIILVGGGALLTNMDAYFTQSLGIPTTRGNVFGGIVVRAPQLPQGYIDSNGPVYAVALGLALRELA